MVAEHATLQNKEKVRLWIFCASSHPIDLVPIFGVDIWNYLVAWHFNEEALKVNISGHFEFYI